MIDDNNTDIDSDIDNLDSFDAGERPATGETLKSVWDNNPLVKIAAVVLGIAVLGGAYVTLTGGKEEQVQNISRVGGAQSKVTATPGAKGELDEEYTKALESENKKRAEVAAKTGVSAMPTPIASDKSAVIDLPAVSSRVTSEDPLKEWRARTEAKRTFEAKTGPREDQLAPKPDVVPLVQPVRPQPIQQVDPKEAQGLAAQMRVIIKSQAPKGAKDKGVTKVESAYEVMMREKAEAKKKAEALAAGKDGTVPPGGRGAVVASTEAVADTDAPVPLADEKTIITAGNISYAQLLNDLNSDIPGPALAQMLSGPLAGGRAIGQFSKQDEYLTITFSRIVKDGVTYSVDGIALDEQTTLSAHQSEVDHHYFRRIILPLAASFVQGYGQAVAETGTSSTTTNGGGVTQDVPEPDATEELATGLDKAFGTLGTLIQQDANKPITIKVNRGTTMGILFMDAVTTASAR